MFKKLLTYGCIILLLTSFNYSKKLRSNGIFDTFAAKALSSFSLPQATPAATATTATPANTAATAAPATTAATPAASANDPQATADNNNQDPQALLMSWMIDNSNQQGNQSTGDNHLMANDPQNDQTNTQHDAQPVYYHPAGANINKTQITTGDILAGPANANSIIKANAVANLSAALAGSTLSNNKNNVNKVFGVTTNIGSAPVNNGFFIH